MAEKPVFPPQEYVDYEKSKNLATNEDARVRAALAGRTEVRPEVLYYLSTDPAVPVRRMVAQNPATPIKAGLLLSQDQDAGVRTLLASRLGHLLPSLRPKEQEHLYRIALTILETLAQDQVTMVRQSLANTLRDVACAPHTLVDGLARDVERAVAEPVLRCCAALTDKDLLSIIVDMPNSWRLQAIAQRDHVSGAVCDALVEAGDSVATGVLLDNQGADISETTLSFLVEESAREVLWQEVLARRKTLPPSLATRLAQFVDRSVQALLRDRKDFDPATTQEIVAVMRRRLTWIEEKVLGETGLQRAIRLHTVKKLDESHISDALSWNDMEFVSAALSLIGPIHPSLIKQVLDSQSAKGVTSLAWRCGLSMRCAMQLQIQWARIPRRFIMNARNGVDYPLTEDEMRWQLDIYGIT